MHPAAPFANRILNPPLPSLLSSSPLLFLLLLLLLRRLQLGDLDGDGVSELAVGAMGARKGRGAVFILYLNRDGSVRRSEQISSLQGEWSFQQHSRYSHAAGRYGLRVTRLNILLLLSSLNILTYMCARPCRLGPPPVRAGPLRVLASKPRGP